MRLEHMRVVIAATALVLACATDRAPDTELASVWNDYQALPEQRALAVARDLGRNLWVAGMSGGQPTTGAAETEALAACQRQRNRKRLQVPCRIYAVGDVVVWRRD
jgi:hypothetical protein